MNRLLCWCERYKITEWIFWNIISPVNIFFYRYYINYLETPAKKKLREDKIAEQLQMLSKLNE